MIIHTTNVMAGPLMLLIWAIDIFLILVALRWLLVRSTNALAVNVRTSIRTIADPAPSAIRSWLTRKYRRCVPAWVAWLVVVVVLVVARQGLLWIIIATAQP